jgi:hypothetical protein
MRRFLSTTFAAALGVATLGGVALGQDQPVTQPEPKGLQPGQTQPQQIEKKMEKGKDTQRAHDEASPAPLPTNGPSDVVQKQEIGERKMEVGKDYDAAQKEGTKAAIPQTATGELLQRQMTHDEQVSQGRNPEEWDSRPVSQ